MKLRDIIRLEVATQARRLWTWLYAAALLVITWQLANEAFAAGARQGGYVVNGPFVVATATLFGSMIGLLLASALAGDAAARDIQTRMHPLVYTAPLGRSAYLGGRFLGALFLNVLILLAVPAGLVAAAILPGVEEDLIGPHRPAAHVTAWLVLALPNAFTSTALLFSIAVITRRAMTSYLTAMALFGTSMVSWQIVGEKLHAWGVARLLDPFGLTALAWTSRAWTAGDKNTLLVGPQPFLLANRLVWMGAAAAVLTLAIRRFRFAHHAGPGGRRRVARSDAPAPREDQDFSIPAFSRSFGLAARARQTLAVARESLQVMVIGWGGLALAGLTALLVVTVPLVLNHLGVPLIPTTGHITPFLSAPLSAPGEIIWLIVPALILFHAGELVWRDREAGLSEIADAAPVPDGARILGRLAGLCLVLVLLQSLMMVAGILIQAMQGWHRFEIGLYARILFGLQLADYVLFALLAFGVHVLVNHKHTGHLVVILTYIFMAFGPQLGIEHHLLLYGTDPGWSWSDMRGFEPFLWPWLWFKLYWSAWAFLLAIAARLFWVRGSEHGLTSRLREARRRFAGGAAGAAVASWAAVLTLGGFIFYNTNVLNAYDTWFAREARLAAYERLYGEHRATPQPTLEGVRLEVDLHPDRRQAQIRGAYRLVNRATTPIASVHVATSPDVETAALAFDRPSRCVRDDRELGHRIHALETPLAPGDAIVMRFEVRFRPRGFTNHGADAAVAGNGTFFRNHDWLPAIGYQREREIRGDGERRAHGLPPRPDVPALDDVAARHDIAGEERIAFEAIVSTDEGQTAVAPGALVRSWTEGGRRWFHYVADAPIRNDYAFFSAAYAVHEARWNDVLIQIAHHPGHAWNLDRMVQSVRASLERHSRLLAPYPHRQIRLVEHPGRSNDLHGFPVNISYEEGFSLLNPAGDPRGIDLTFAVVAHEVAHQWWGNMLSPAFVEGAGLLTETLAWHSALAVVEETHGRDHMERLLGMMREAYLTPRSRAGLPLLRSISRFDASRRGIFAMHAVRETIGADRVDTALRRLIEEHGRAAPPLPTSLDLYTGLRSVTPREHRRLLADLFETNTYWELAVKEATTRPAAAPGAWEVALDVRARKVVVDQEGKETEVPMDDLVEVGVFQHSGEAAHPGPLLAGLHRIRSGDQRLTVTVPFRPARAAVDPRHLLIDDDPSDNVRDAAPAAAAQGSLRTYSSKSSMRAPGA
jgi:hypothetical protein